MCKDKNRLHSTIEFLLCSSAYDAIIEKRKITDMFSKTLSPSESGKKNIAQNNWKQSTIEAQEKKQYLVYNDV